MHCECVNSQVSVLLTNLLSFQEHAELVLAGSVFMYVTNQLPRMVFLRRVPSVSDGFTVSSLCLVSLFICADHSRVCFHEPTGSSEANQRQ